MRLILALFLLLGFCACRSDAPAPGRVQHLVFCWLKEPGKAEARQQLIDAAKKLSDIPGVVSIRAGTAVASDRPVVDSSFDVGIVITFDSVASMQAYLVHPRHQTAVNTLIKPLTSKLLVYDIVEGEDKADPQQMKAY